MTHHHQSRIRRLQRGGLTYCRVHEFDYCFICEMTKISTLLQAQAPQTLAVEEALGYLPEGS